MSTTRTARTRRPRTVRRAAARSAPAPARDLDAVAELPAVAGSQSAFGHFRPEAEAIPAERVIVCRASALVAYHNAARGAAAVLAQRTALGAARDAPRPDWSQIESVEPIALGLIFASGEAAFPASTDGTLQRDLAEALAVRSVLLSDARTLALKGIFPADRVAAIVRGRGPIDKARDCVQLAALYQGRGGALRGKTAVTDGEVARAAELGSSLLQRLRPSGVRSDRRKTGEARASADLRDRFWTLLTERYALVEQVGGWLWARSLDAHVPSLQSRAQPARRTQPAQPTPGSHSTTPAATSPQ